MCNYDTILLLVRCVKDINSGVSKLLKYIGSLKGLAAIRDTVWDLIREVRTTIELEQK